MTTPTPSDIAKIVEQILAAATDHEDVINMIAGIAGVLPEVSLAEKALPAIITILQVLQGGNSRSPLDALQVFLNHNTPGMPNAPELAPTPEAS